MGSVLVVFPVSHRRVFGGRLENGFAYWQIDCERVKRRRDCELRRSGMYERIRHSTMLHTNRISATVGNSVDATGSDWAWNR